VHTFLRLPIAVPFVYFILPTIRVCLARDYGHLLSLFPKSSLSRVTSSLTQQSDSRWEDFDFQIGSPNRRSEESATSPQSPLAYLAKYRCLSRLSITHDRSQSKENNKVHQNGY
jgi:hypothetical protein